MAQLAEQLICNQQVNGSSPFIGFNGQIPEWPKGTDCKSAGDAFEGSNPSPPIFRTSRDTCSSFYQGFDDGKMKKIEKSC